MNFSPDHLSYVFDNFIQMERVRRQISHPTLTGSGGPSVR